MQLKDQKQLQRLLPILALGGLFFWSACSKKPTSVVELFPDLVLDERSQTKQFAVEATGSEPMIDDLEDGDLNGIKADGRNWSWAQFDDMTDGIQYLTIDQEEGGPRPGNTLYIKGGGWQKTGAGVSANLVYKASPRMYGYYDASVFSGIEFWIKAKDLKQLTVSIGIPETTSTNDGGICISSLPGHFEHQATISDERTHIQIPFSGFSLKSGDKEFAVNPARMKGLHFSFQTMNDYEIWLDEIAFYR